MSVEGTKKVMTDRDAWMALRAEFFPRDSEIVSSRRQIDDMLLQTIASNIDIAEPVSVVSHRPFVGAVIVFIRTAMIKLARPWIKVCLRRQQVINEQVMVLASTVQELKLLTSQK